MSDDVYDRKKFKEAQRAAELVNSNRLACVRGIMSERVGRDYILGWLEAGHVFQSSFNPDPLRMAFMEGERNAGLRLLNDIMQACPESYLLMMQERNERDVGRARTTNRTDSDRGDSGPEPDPDGPDPNFVDYDRAN